MTPKETVVNGEAGAQLPGVLSVDGDLLVADVGIAGLLNGFARLGRSVLQEEEERAAEGGGSGGAGR